MEILKSESWLRPQVEDQHKVMQSVQMMFDQFDEMGWPAIEATSQKFDGFKPYIIELQPFDSYDLEPDLKRAIVFAHKRIKQFAEVQRESIKSVEYEDQFGYFGSRVETLESMAAYVPGGRFPLISSALMTLVPAEVASVPRRMAFSPSDHPALLAACSLAGATSFLRIGGAQAIYSATHGTPYNHGADVVVGPGNAFVNAAKALVQNKVRIDALAGPSELLVLADQSINPTWVAADILAQAEHDPKALSICAATSEEELKLIEFQVRQQKQEADGLGIIQWVVCRDRQELIQFANKVASEHLHVTFSPNELEMDQLKNYGSLFVGAYSAVAFGDYCSGPNHTLPTLGTARFRGGLSVLDFLKVVTTQSVSKDGLTELAKHGGALARAEGLKHHERSMAIRS